VDYENGARRPTSSSWQNTRPQIWPARPSAKKDLLTAFGMRQCGSERFRLIGIVSSFFAAQKGFDLIAQIMDRLAREEMNVVALARAISSTKCSFRLNKQFPQQNRGEGAYAMPIATSLRLDLTCS